MHLKFQILFTYLLCRVHDALLMAKRSHEIKLQYSKSWVSKHYFWCICRECLLKMNIINFTSQILDEWWYFLFFFASFDIEVWLKKGRCDTVYDILCNNKKISIRFIIFSLLVKLPPKAKKRLSVSNGESHTVAPCGDLSLSGT